MNDPVNCFKECGLNYQDDKKTNKNTQNHSNECDICLNELEANEEQIILFCGHKFCKICLKEYLTRKIEEGNSNEILCPGYECYLFIEHSIIEDKVSPQIARKYLQFGLKSFVDTNPLIKWCPNANCGLAIKRQFLTNDSEITYSRSIECSCGHYYCWTCLQEGHEPVSCQHWKQWFEKIRQMQSKDGNLDELGEQEEISANNLWLLTNSKNCPNCKTSIEKNEGCNHVKCIKCKYDFCWVCLESWKIHSSTTGGYFQCNRFQIIDQLNEKEKAKKEQIETEYTQLIEYNRFVHYYSRFKNHEKSLSIEKPLLEHLEFKFSVYNPSIGFDFIENALKELIKARRVLGCSYVYGYFLVDKPLKKNLFELVQNEFETQCEILSQIVARPYLKTPKSNIIKETKLLKQKRLDFMEVIARKQPERLTFNEISEESDTEFEVNLDKAIRESLKDVQIQRRDKYRHLFGVRFYSEQQSDYDDNYENDLETAIFLSLQTD